MRARLFQFYKDEVIKRMMDEFKLKNKFQTPKIEKIVINVGVGEAVNDIKELDYVIENLKVITGQMPKINRAKKAEAGFKLRKGMPIGTSVTLRRDRMYEFLDRLINIAIPRIRDFRGLSPSSFDGRGNYNFGISEHIIFPEIEIDKVKKVFGLNVTITTTAKTDDQAKALLKYLGMPFKRE